jgi:hypothetical protein
MISQAIHRICHGLIDRDAGQYAVNLQLNSVEDVIDKIKSYKFHHAAIYTHDRGYKVREVTGGHELTDDGPLSETLHIEREKQYSRSSKTQSEAQGGFSNKSIDQRLSSLESGLGSLRSEILQAFKSLENKTGTRSRSPSSSPNRFTCFECGGRGHFKSVCPSKKSENRPARKVHFEENPLNSK